MNGVDQNKKPRMLADVFTGSTYSSWNRSLAVGNLAGAQRAWLAREPVNARITEIGRTAVALGIGQTAGSRRIGQSVLRSQAAASVYSAIPGATIAGATRMSIGQIAKRQDWGMPSVVMKNLIGQSVLTMPRYEPPPSLVRSVLKMTSPLSGDVGLSLLRSMRGFTVAGGVMPRMTDMRLPDSLLRAPSFVVRDPDVEADIVMNDPPPQILPMQVTPGSVTERQLQALGWFATGGGAVFGVVDHPILGIFLVGWGLYVQLLIRYGDPGL